MIPETLERKTEVSNAAPARHSLLRQAAVDLSLKNVDMAVCELLNEALTKAVYMAYEQDEGGLCNVDSATGRLLIPAPWGRSGHAKWGLRTTESDILRAILLQWQGDTPSLFRYDRARRSWFVSLHDYANIHLAKRWLAKHPIDVGLYRGIRGRLVAAR